MSDSLSALLIRLRRDPALKTSWQCPVLLWEAAGTAEGEHWEQTRGQAAHQPLAGDPRVFRVEKIPGANAFMTGVTLGRVESNDLVLEDDSISRFHAFLRFDEPSRAWLVTDAESKNGTWLDGVKLAPNVAARLEDGARLRFGDAALQFLFAPTFLARVDPR